MAKAGPADMGGGGNGKKSGWAVSQSFAEQVPLPPTSRRVFTRPSRVQATAPPPPLIGRRLAGCACLDELAVLCLCFPFRSQLAGDVRLPWMVLYTYTFWAQD